MKTVMRAKYAGGAWASQMAGRLAGVFLVVVAAGRAAEPAIPPSAQLNTDDLALAAACLDRGEEAAAASHLARHLAAYPDRPLVRFSLAELHWRREQLGEAGVEFERFVHDTPPRRASYSRLIHAHSRLVAIAERSGDDYGAHLNRGIGLYLSARRDADAAEALLCKAAGELTLATRDRPAEARPHWYLHLTWAQLAQSQPAARHLRRAAALAEHSNLAPHERRALAEADDRTTR
jgi:hypothetical protein